MKKKPLCIKELAHGKSDENDQANWISAVATLINTDIIASGKSFCSSKYSICYRKCANIFLIILYRVMRWKDSCVEIGRKLP